MTTQTRVPRRTRSGIAALIAEASSHRTCDPGAAVVSAAQLLELGLHRSTITKRCRPGGPWRRLAPGVVMLGPGRPTRDQLLKAATLRLGTDCVITGTDALSAHGLDLPRPHPIHVLVPSHRRVSPPGFVAVERTARVPAPVMIGDLPFAPPARAALDAARREHAPDRLHDLLSLPIHRGLCTFDELTAELDSGSQRGTAAARAQLRRLEGSPDRETHRLARELIRRCPLPPPRWGVTVEDMHGQRIGGVDAWWDEVGMGWLYTQRPKDSRTGHDRRHAPARGREHAPGVGPRDSLALTAAGVVLVRTSPHTLRGADDTILAELARAFRRAALRPRPRVRCAVRGAAA